MNDKNSSAPTAKQKSAGQIIFNNILDWIEIFVFSLAFVILLFTFVLRLAVVSGPSMENTLMDGETLVISKLMYTPKQGDVIVFQSPTSSFDEPIVKRVIATENQVVDIDFYNWTVSVDGVEIKEDYVKHSIGSMLGSDYSYPFVVPEGMVFVMGDNRNNSTDSRSFHIGPVDTRFILGEVKLRLFPFDRFGAVN